MNQYLQSVVELYRRGNYELLGLFDRQLEALFYLSDDEVNEILYGGGARGGKSWILCIWKALRRLSMDGSVGMLCREENTKLRDTTQKTFFKVLDFLQAVEGVDYFWRAGKQEVEFQNGSVEMFKELKYMPAKDPEFDRIGSYDLTDVGVDESQQIFWKAIQVLKGRCSVLKGESKVVKNGVITKIPWETIPKLAYTCNPAKNWTYTDFYAKDKKGELEPTKKFVRSLAEDNPHVPCAYIENLKTADRVTRERLLYGNFEYDDDPDSLCEWDAICDIFNNDHVEEKEQDRWLVADLAMGGRDKFIVTAWKGLVGRVVINEGKSTGKSIEESLREEKKKLRVPNRHIIADSDGMGNYLSSYLDNIKEFHGGSSAPDSKYGMLKDQCGFKLAEMINESKLRIICSKEDEEEISQQISMCLKRSANIDDNKHRLIKKSVMKEKLGYSPDLFDNLLMRMLPLIKKEYVLIL